MTMLAYKLWYGGTGIGKLTRISPESNFREWDGHDSVVEVFALSLQRQLIVLVAPVDGNLVCFGLVSKARDIATESRFVLDMW